MAKRTGGAIRKSKHKLEQYYRDKGKIPLSRYFQEFNPGERVALVANRAVAEGRYFRRFHGETGKVLGKKGSCYQVCIKDGSKQKVFNVHPIHLKRIR